MNSQTSIIGKAQTPSTLQLVQIYFDSATFDDIERDKKVKFNAQLSMVGGTLGLLSGFSIISGIEIIFFLIRLLEINQIVMIDQISNFLLTG